MNNGNIVELKNITVAFDGETVLDDLSLAIRDSEFVTFLGASGCGKTTTLRVIGGFIEPQAGDVFFDGKRINGVPPHKRSVNTIFQRYALFPNYNVYENIAFGLRVSRVPEAEIRERVNDMLRLVNLQGFEKNRELLCVFGKCGRSGFFECGFIAVAPRNGNAVYAGIPCGFDIDIAVADIYGLVL